MTHSDGGVTTVPVDSIPIDQFESVLTRDQMLALREQMAASRRYFQGRVVWHVNSTAKGGGVAEMLAALLPYARGTGVDARWLVITADELFFRVTKRLHNHLHGDEGDSRELAAEELSHYEQIARARAEAIASMVSLDDLVVLHDPQTAGMVPLLARHCSGVVWRCHVGSDGPNALVRNAQTLLLRYVRDADALIFSRRQFVWEGLEQKRVEVFAPSIDPFSAKNRSIEPEQVGAILAACGVIPDHQDSEHATFERQDGRRSKVSHRADVQQTTPIPGDARLIVQVSRWDRLKDPLGVLEGFHRQAPDRDNARLVLAGPAVAEVKDDPEGREVYMEVRARWESLPDEVRSQVHLVCLPMDDDEENAAMVNALQRRADVVVQKSLAEGFGLTVSEAMWKSRPTVASAVGGIQDQIEDGVSGVLLPDPRDLDDFGRRVFELLNDRARAKRIGANAHLRVRDQFLGTRALIQYDQLLSTLRR
ncbi:MAG TPA: glycosyltransferase [Candidatus Dormibacteraeota bacterium]|nr:glycosyltransferase [Candidatus Dormibacteraeota bacterium]